jgi:dCTP deaminase
MLASTSMVETVASPSAVLTDREILHFLTLPPDHPDRLIITPIIRLKDQLHPVSFDLRLGTEFIVFENSGKAHLDPLEMPRDANVFNLPHSEARFVKRLTPSDEFVLHSHEFALGSTLEYVRLPNVLAGRLDGRSTWARLGIQVHSTAALVHPGSRGVITFELLNVSMLPIKLYVGMRIAQVNFYRLSPDIIRSYDSIPTAKHSGHVRASPSAYWKDPEFDIIRRRIAARKDGNGAG